MSEQISALMDGEIEIEDAAHLIASMQSSRQAADAWSQYHIIGDAMRGNTLLSNNFKHNLMHKIELEPTVLAPRSVIHSEKSVEFKDKLPAKWSIAASFAAVMVVGWMAMHQTQSVSDVPTLEIAKADVSEQSIPSAYLTAHQSSAPSASSYYIQSVSYAE